MDARREPAQTIREHPAFSSVTLIRPGSEPEQRRGRLAGRNLSSISISIMHNNSHEYIAIHFEMLKLQSGVAKSAILFGRNNNMFALSDDVSELRPFKRSE
jgi:hypothetical protein